MSKTVFYRKDLFLCLCIETERILCSSYFVSAIFFLKIVVVYHLKHDDMQV